MVFHRIAKCALAKKEYVHLNLNDILYNWEACMSCGTGNWRRVVPWAPPLPGMLKYNVDGVRQREVEPGRHWLGVAG